MTLIQKYTTEILREFTQYDFDNRETGDLAKCIGNILLDFQEEVKEREKHKQPTLQNLKRLNNDYR